MKENKISSIAVVDDHDFFRRETINVLLALGFDVNFQACNGREFLDILANENSMPDVCLLDINMPIMDGFETTRYLHEQHPHIKILAYSMFNDKERIEKITSLGAHGFIEKDAGPDQLRQAILDLLL